MLVPRRVLFELFKKRNGITNNFCARTTPRAQRDTKYDYFISLG